MQPVNILDSKQLDLTLNRLAFQLTERYLDFDNTAIIGLQRTGAFLSAALVEKVISTRKGCRVLHGLLDVTFFRDDFGRRDKPLAAYSTELDFPIEGKRIIIVDDVLYTGRSVRAALDAMISFGRPKSVELLVLIDRKYTRDLPIQPDYTGKQVDSLDSQKVLVEWKEEHGQDVVYIVKPNNE